MTVHFNSSLKVLILYFKGVDAFEEQCECKEYQGNDKLLLGIVLVLLPSGFCPDYIEYCSIMQTDLGIDVNTTNIAVSITALFSGIFYCCNRGLGDKFGRVKTTKIGLILIS